MSRTAGNAAKKTETLPSSSRYQISRCIAKGGMGAVYVGVQRGAGGFARPVAIKRTHAHLLVDEGARKLILEEARLASSVRHPNVVSINDVEEVDGELLLVMDFIEGGSLSQLIARAGQLPMGVALRVLIDVCAGIDAIHTAKDEQGIPLGLVHRDVSPQNVLVGFDGVARVTDFGIAKSAASPKRTAKNVRRGKYGYMAPEYLKTGTVTSGADLFGIGVLLWESLAGRRLFKGEDNAETIRLGIKAEVPSLADELGISPILDAVILRSLARSPVDRYRSAAELGAAIEHAARDLIASRIEVTTYVQSVMAQPKVVAPPPLPLVAANDADAIDAAPSEEVSGISRTAASAGAPSAPPPSLPSMIDELAPLLEPSLAVRVPMIPVYTVPPEPGTIAPPAAAMPANDRWDDLKTPPARTAHKVFRLEDRLATLPEADRLEATKNIRVSVRPAAKAPASALKKRWLWGLLAVTLAATAVTTSTVYAAHHAQPAQQR